MELVSLLPKDATAAVVRDEPQNLFKENRDARIQHLETALCTIRQRDEPVGHYYQRLKALADELRELGVPVTYQTLLTMLLAGITDKFSNLRSVIRLLHPPPSFAEVRSMLKLGRPGIGDGHGSISAAVILQQHKLYTTSLYSASTGFSATSSPPYRRQPQQLQWQEPNSWLSTPEHVDCDTSKRIYNF
jgi:hypothetical protein